MKRIIATALALTCFSAVNVHAEESAGKFRGVWIATVANTNWPDKGASAESQKAAFVKLMEEAASMRLNAVVVQIRPTADAFYKSELNPWSEYIAGTQGKDPGYDPLAFMVEEAHKRGLEFHAWFNPFRVSMNNAEKTWASNSVVVQHPDRVVTYGGQKWLDPGLPTVRKYVVDSIIEVVRNYNIDAVHFDDYFYPYPTGGKNFPDDWSYGEYGNGMSRDDWRRSNIDEFIKTVNMAVKAEKNYVKFGVSPLGVWRSKTVDPDGSDSTAAGSYDTLYADTRLWVKENWVDYIAPQLYWELGYRTAPYESLLKFWVNMVKGSPNVHLYIGEAAYRIGNAGAWRDSSQLPRHLELSADYPEVKGHIFYNIDSLIDNPLSIRDKLTESFYTADAGVPAMPWLGDRPSAYAANTAD
ncbi:MAG: family 10 glycosylhydrolase [Clostridiales bacterium]|nr:family 10 glycosylhydrolase [Clostridiales bacterium]